MFYFEKLKGKSIQAFKHFKRTEMHNTYKLIEAEHF